MFMVQVYCKQTMMNYILKITFYKITKIYQYIRFIYVYIPLKRCIFRILLIFFLWLPFKISSVNLQLYRVRVLNTA